MNERFFEDIELIDDILQAEDFVRLRMETGFAEVPVEHARRALQNGLVNVSVTVRYTGIFRKLLSCRGIRNRA